MEGKSTTGVFGAEYEDRDTFLFFVPYHQFRHFLKHNQLTISKAVYSGKNNVNWFNLSTLSIQIL